MSEQGVQLELNRTQCQQWYAHIFTYTYLLLFHSRQAQEKATREAIQRAGSRLLALCMQEGPTMIWTLSEDEVGLLKQMCTALQQMYEAYPQAEHYQMALEHLEACRLMLEQAEQAP